MNEKAKTRKGSALVLLAALAWSTMGPLTRKLNTMGLYSFEVSQIRLTTAFVMIFLFILVVDRRMLKIRLKDVWCFLGTGLCSLLMYCICYFRALESASISVVTVLTYMSPVYIMLMSAVLFREKITGKKLLALGLSIGGCVLVSGVLFGITGSAKGLLLGLAAGFFYALYSIFAKYAIERGYQSWTILLYTFGLAMVGCSFLCSWQTIGTAIQTHAGTLPLCLLFGMVTCVIPYAMYSMGLGMIELSRASILNCMDVVSSTILAAIFFREYPSVTTVAGIVLVLSSVVVLSRPEKKPKTKTEASDTV